MASFNPNPNEQSEMWIERPVKDDLDFRIWHVIFFCFAGVIFTVIFVCCCVKFRIPRTKQDIEADYQRKKITGKFREKLKLIENQEMDAMDLKRALEIIQDELQHDASDQQMALHKHSKSDCNISFESTSNHSQSGMMAEPQQPSNGGIH